MIYIFFLLSYNGKITYTLHVLQKIYIFISPNYFHSFQLIDALNMVPRNNALKNKILEGKESGDLIKGHLLSGLSFFVIEPGKKKDQEMNENLLPSQ